MRVTLVLVAVLAVAALSGVAAYPFASCGSSQDVLSFQAVEFSAARGVRNEAKVDGVARRAVEGGSVEIATTFNGANGRTHTIDLGRLTSLPIAPGAFSLTRPFTLPEKLPTGNYEATARFRDQDGNDIGCLSLQWQ